MSLHIEQNIEQQNIEQNNIEQVSEQKIEQKPELDYYAKPYIPQLLLELNERPATHIITTPLPGINYHEYVSRFAG